MSIVKIEKTIPVTIRFTVQGDGHYCKTDDFRCRFHSSYGCILYGRANLSLKRTPGCIEEFGIISEVII